MVTESRVVAGEAKHLVDPKRRGGEQLALQGEAIAVAADHLQHGGEPGLLELDAADEGGGPHHGRLDIGDVDGMGAAAVVLGLLDHVLEMAALRRRHLSGDEKLPAVYGFT